MIDEPRWRYGRASRASATSEYADTSSASANPSRDVSTNEPSRSSRFAYAIAWTRMSTSPCWSCHLASTALISSSFVTSHGSTNGDPMLSASGRTRRSIRLSTEEKPTTAPSSWNALAMPQAIEWSFATPNTSALRPSSRPIRGVLLGRLRMMPDLSGPDPSLRAALHGVRGLLLDLDGVLVLKGAPVPGAGEAVRALDAARFPYLVVTNTSLMSRAALARWGASAGFTTPADRFQSALSASAGIVARELGGRAAYVICSEEARSEFTGLNVVSGEQADADPGSVAAVVLGDSPEELTKANLDRAFRLVLGGAELIGMHRNPWWLTPDGPTLDAGTFLVGLEWATKRRARIVGKPSPAFFSAAVERLQAEAAARGELRLRRGDLAMVGDDVGADVGGGHRAGLRTVFVRTGKHGDAELEAAASPRRGTIRPDAVAPSVAEVVAAVLAGD